MSPWWLLLIVPIVALIGMVGGLILVDKLIMQFGLWRR